MHAYSRLVACKQFELAGGARRRWRANCKSCRHSCPPQIKKQLRLGLRERREAFASGHLLASFAGITDFYWVDAGVNRHWAKVCVVHAASLNPHRGECDTFVKDIKTGNSGVAEFWGIIEALRRANHGSLIYIGNDWNDTVSAVKQMKCMRNGEMRALQAMIYKIIEGKNIKVLINVARKNRAGAILAGLLGEERRATLASAAKGRNSQCVP